mmetsp:Transcript_20762/g.43652  ORF Transcript_20762/g.43652 Transcript_20762/m.43652 type:complete len:161 (-) Transcript_20762:532-1014(-)
MNSVSKFPVVFVARVMTLHSLHHYKLISSHILIPPTTLTNQNTIGPPPPEALQNYSMNLIVDFRFSRNNSDRSDTGCEIDENRVIFSDYSQIRFIPSFHRSEFTEDMWFSRDQLEGFKREYSVTLDQMKSESHGDMFQYVIDHVDDSSIFMGLEPFLNDS